MNHRLVRRSLLLVSAVALFAWAALPGYQPPDHPEGLPPSVPQQFPPSRDSGSDSEEVAGRDGDGEQFQEQVVRSAVDGGLVNLAADVASSFIFVQARQEGARGTLAAPAPLHPSKPFENACSAETVGRVGSDGLAPRLAITNIPPAAVMECRTGRASSVDQLPFSACGATDGTRRIYHVPLIADGLHVSEVRYHHAGQVSKPMRLAYYVHASLNSAPCCNTNIKDDDWYAAARSHLRSSPAFGTSTRLANPFIKISAAKPLPDVDVLSLRRTFRIDAGRGMILITRSTAARGGRAGNATPARHCVGIEVRVPQRKSPVPIRPSCHDTEMSGYESAKAGALPSECPSLFCTVSRCKQRPDGCVVTTHTFYRGKGQRPWVVDMPAKCPRPGDYEVARWTTHRCDAYVVNARGRAVCLGRDGDRPRVLAVLDQWQGIGLQVLRPQRHSGVAYYSFSAKSKRPVQEPGVLFLPL